MKIKNILIAVLALLLIGFIIYRISKNNAKNEGFKAKDGLGKAILVNGIIANSETFDNYLSLSGSIEANEQVEIRSEVSGIVEAIYFKEGSTVQKGQTLFKVNDIELRAQLRQAQTRQSLASENQRRAKLLLQKEAISQEEFDISNSDFRLAQSQSQLIQAQINKTAVRAPFSGKIGLRYISPGTYITPTVLVANLVNISKVKITFSIPEKYASQAKAGATLTFTISGSDKKYAAVVYAIEPQVDTNTRTLQIRATADNKDGSILPGSYASVSLRIDQLKDAFVVPTEAVIPLQKGKKLFICKDGKTKEIMVETATRTDASLVVISGVKEGDTIITSGVMSLKDDMPIKVKIK